jgi:hypothetical protein
MYTRGSHCSEKVQESASKRHPPPLIDEFAENLADSLAYEFPSDETAAKLRPLVRHRDDISPEVRQLLVQALQALAARATELANHLAKDFDASATLKIVKPLDEDQRNPNPNEGNGLTVAESHGTVDVVEHDNTHQTFNTRNHFTHLPTSYSEATSRNAAGSSS